MDVETQVQNPDEKYESNYPPFSYGLIVGHTGFFNFG